MRACVCGKGLGGLRSTGSPGAAAANRSLCAKHKRPRLQLTRPLPPAWIAAICCRLRMHTAWWCPACRRPQASAAAAKESLAASERRLGEATAKLAAGEKELAALKAAVKVGGGWGS